MGKGGYNGGSTVIGPGSGWFSKPKPAPAQPKKKRKKKAAVTDRSKLPEGQQRGLTKQEWLAKINGKVVDLGREVENAKRRLQRAEENLARAKAERLQVIGVNVPVPETQPGPLKAMKAPDAVPRIDLVMRKDGNEGRVRLGLRAPPAGSS